jgi:hypothetical protein
MGWADHYRRRSARLDGNVDEDRVTAELAAEEPVLRAVLDAHLSLSSYRTVGMTP